MRTSRERDLELMDAADAAYRRARVLVYDRLAAGEPVVMGCLSSNQRDAMIDLAVAEADLTDYRRRKHEPARAGFVMGQQRDGHYGS
jgi:hypothetical protein